MTSQKFDEMYKKLNVEQREAVDTIEGPVMVVAGPGTGKTQILTLRIANILRTTDTRPENILALTFTESGVASMRKRLAEIIGSRAYGVVISTFHGFCNEVIKNYPEEFPRIIGSRNITEVDQVGIIEKLIDETELDLLRPYGDRFLYVRSILSSINELKREGITPATFVELVTEEEKEFQSTPDLYHEKGAHKGKMKSDYQKLEKQIVKNKELASVYVTYEEELTLRKFYDYGDMIMEVLRALATNASLLQILQEEHQYLLVDEHQDTNNAQNKILELLCNFHQNPNVFIVGDAKQAIFRFQGASLENFYYFKTLYPEAKLITLVHNYRSTQSILDSAHSLIGVDEKLHANAKHEEKKIHLGAFKTIESELYFVVQDIAQKIKSGMKPEEIAVLYRDNRDAFALARMLEKLTVPFFIESDQDLFSDTDVRKIIILLRAIAELGNDEQLALALHIDFLNIDPLDIYKLMQTAYKEKISLYALLADRIRLQNPQLHSQEKIDCFYNLLSILKTESKNQDLLTFFEKVIRDSGLLKSLLASPEGHARLEAINGFFDEMKALVESNPTATLEDFMKYLAIVEKHAVFVKKKKSGGSVGKIRLMTAHRSKGLEFEYVYIIHAYDGHFGNKTNRDKLKLLPRVFNLKQKAEKFAALGDEEDKNDDERRLFYVALTRAKKAITITYALTDSSGREQLPSVFLGEIKPELIEGIDTSAHEAVFEKNKLSLFEASKGKEVGIPEQEFVREIFLNQGLSVSALNNYLACPWQYFYRNLVRIPSVPDKYQAYGIAVHAVLRDLFVKIKDEEITLDFVLAGFERYLNLQPLKVYEYTELLAKGKESLSGWFTLYHKTWNTNVLTEFKINGVLLTPEIRLTGVLDKLEFTGDGGQVNVVDYKTGSPKTRNELMGSTKDADGNYYRQLVFYKILLNHYESGKYNMASGEIDFVEPDAKGKYKKEKFDILPEQVAALEEEIKKVADDILNVRFWNARCDDKKCEYCALRNLITKNTS